VDVAPAPVRNSMNVMCQRSGDRSWDAGHGTGVVRWPKYRFSGEWSDVNVVG